MHQLFELVPNEYELFMGVVILIGGGKLFDNLLGNNNAILFSSDYYRLILYIGIGMAILAIILNWIFIPIYGVLGAAIATFGAVFSYNMAKLWIVSSKFKMHPFSKKTFVTILLVILCIAAFYFWNFDFHPIINIGLKSVLIGLCYITILYLLKISEDINVIIKKVF